MKQTLLTATAIALVFSAPAFGDDDTQALRAQIKALEARLDQLEKREKQHAKEAQAKTYAAPVAAAPAPIEKRLAIVERKQEIAAEDAAAKAETNPKVEVGYKGLSVVSADKQYSVNFRTYFQVDNRTFIDGGATGTTSTSLIRSARPIIDAKLTDYFNARFMMDFGKGSSQLLDAYADYHPDPGSTLANLRIGEFKVPVGLERWQSEQELLFVERGQTTNLVPFRDIGAMAYGEIIPGQLEYQLGVVNGAADLQANNTDADSKKDVVARVFTYPFRWSEAPWIEGLGFGLGGTFGTHHGTTGTPNLAAGYSTVGQRTYFTYRTAVGQTVVAHGPQWRLNPTLMYYNGPFSLLGDYVINQQEVMRGTTQRNLRNTAWEGITTYVLTGENAAFDGVKPDHPFNPSIGDWGAFEIAGRMSRLDVDKSAFPFFADPLVSSRSAFESTIGGNWYINNSLKLNLDYSFTKFEGGSGNSFDHSPEKVVMTRAQVRF